MNRSTKQPRPKHCMVVFAPYPIGETRVQREAEALVKAGYEVDVISLRTPGSAAVEPYKGVTVYRESYRFLAQWFKAEGLTEKFLRYLVFLFTAAFRLTRLHLRKRYDSIQVHNMPDFLVLSALIPKLMGAPVVLDIHDLMPEFYAERYRKGGLLALKFVRLQEKLACRFANHIITVTEQWRQSLIQRGVPAEKCSVVMNVADESIFTPFAPRQYQHDKDGCFRLVYHGTFAQRNGLDLAIEAIHRVRKDIPNIQLLLIGNGDYLPQMKRAVEELGLQRSVIIEGLRLVEELPAILKACDLGIVPIKSNVFTDTALSTKLMEYAAMGLPAVAARTSANEAYFHDTNAEFFEPGSVDDLVRCILTLYRSPDRMTELARGGENFNHRYNWSHMSAAYVNLIEGLRKKK